MSAKPFTVGNQVTNWILAEGRTASPQQADREVYENGVEAPGTTMCFFFGFQNDKGLLCKAHADNGEGMDRVKHLEYMETILNTGTNKVMTPGAPPNKGVGARIAALAHNVDGMDSYSRTPAEAKAGEPWHQVRLSIDGVEIFDIYDHTGAFIGKDTIVDADDWEIDQFPDFVKKTGHGTIVVFRGDGVNDGWTDESWKATHQYMQSRYYALPIPVWVDGESLPSMAGLKRSDYRYNVPSLSDYYAKHVGHQGVFTTSDGADIEWFVFDHMANGTKFDAIRKRGVHKGKPFGVNMETGPARSNGFRGVVIRDGNENFEHSTQRFSTFNIIGQRATSRVSLVITPPAGMVEPSTNRQNLVMIGGGEIPWYRWGAEFSEKMPDPIQELMEKDFKRSDTITAEDLDRLDPDWFKRVSSRKTLVVNPDGTIHVEEDQDVVAREGSSGRRGGGGTPPKPGPGPNPGDQPGKRGGNHRSANRKLAKPGTGAMGTQENLRYLDLQVTWLPDTHPDPAEPIWSGVVADADCKDRGWCWFPGVGHTIYMRMTGDPYNKTLKKFLDLKPKALKSKVWNDVKDAYAMEAIAKVVHIRELAHTGVWTSSDVLKMWTGLELSGTLAGLNAVEATVALLLRKKP